MFFQKGQIQSAICLTFLTMLLALVAAWVTHWLGLSMALGAFLAGMMLGESHFRHQIEADLRPFRDLLLGLFFISVGMLVDPNLFAEQWHWIILAAVSLMLFKAVLMASLGHAAYDDRVARLQEGSVVEKVGAFAMQGDPLTSLVADKVEPLLRCTPPGLFIRVAYFISD